MRSTLTRRLRVWEQLFNQTQREGKRGVTTTSAMTKSDGVVSMWSQVEAAPKVCVMIRFVFYLFRWGFSAAKDHCRCERFALGLVSRETFR